MRVAAKITLSETDRQILEKNTKSKAVSIRLSERSKIVLLSAEGLKNKDIAQRLNIAPKDLLNNKLPNLIILLAGYCNSIPHEMHYV